MKKLTILVLIVLLMSSVSMMAFAGKSNACGGLENAYWHLAPDNPDRADLIANMQSAGCDDDGDGVINVLDTCAGTAAGAAVNENGCAIEQLLFTFYATNSSDCELTATFGDQVFTIAAGGTISVTVYGGYTHIHAETSAASTCGELIWEVDLFIDESLGGITFVQ